MKKFFLSAVALSALCSSCETTDQSFLEETNTTHVPVQITSSAANADYDTYTAIVSSFVYAKDQTYAEIHKGLNNM